MYIITTFKSFLTQKKVITYAKHVPLFKEVHDKCNTENNMCLKLDKNIKNVLYPLTEWIQGKRHVAYSSL